MTRAFLTGAGLSALLLAPSVAVSQTVDEIITKHLAARGGMEKIKAIQTLKITRTVATGLGTPVKVIIYRKRPHLYRAEQGPAVPGGTLVPRAVNANDAWETVQGKIVKRPEAAEAQTRDLDADFDGLLVDWKEKGHTVAFEGREPMPAGDALKLRVKTRSGAERVIYLDAATFLERRHTGVLTLPNGRKFDVAIDFSNWREVNGVKFPFDIIEERTGDAPVQSFVTYTESIEANVPIDDALFATPAGAGGG
jgi:hypothetical protein